VWIFSFNAPAIRLGAVPFVADFGLKCGLVGVPSRNAHVIVHLIVVHVGMHILLYTE
jgi:hypothetical protein